VNLLFSSWTVKRPPPNNFARNASRLTWPQSIYSQVIYRVHSFIHPRHRSRETWALPERSPFLFFPLYLTDLRLRSNGIGPERGRLRLTSSFLSGHITLAEKKNNNMSAVFAALLLGQWHAGHAIYVTINEFHENKMFSINVFISVKFRQPPRKRISFWMPSTSCELSLFGLSIAQVLRWNSHD